MELRVAKTHKPSLRKWKLVGEIPTPKGQAMDKDESWDSATSLGLVRFLCSSFSHSYPPTLPLVFLPCKVGHLCHLGRDRGTEK